MNKTLTMKNILRTLVLIVLVGCTDVNVEKEQKESLVQTLSPTGVKTTVFEKAKFEEINFVSISSEVDLENGTKEAPYKSILKALENTNSGLKSAIVVAAGEYAEGTIHLNKGVSIFGGFSTSNWRRDVTKNKTILLAKDNERILTASDHSTIDGFVFSKASYRGTGAAIYCEGTSPIISNNVFILCI